MVVVPSHINSERLVFAAQLAHELTCPLLVICTQGKREAVARVVATVPVRRNSVFVLALPHGSPMPTLFLRTSGEPAADFSRKFRDLALKRNTATAIARLLGWSPVLFLDDDVRGIRAVDVRRACALLSGGQGWCAAGWMTTEFPDNSAVCHAGRLTGLQQGIFIGSGALALRVDERTPVFPAVYNEDWCFLFELLRSRNVLLMGQSQQLPYDPFDPVVNRGGYEEFGDILGEGLFHLLHHGADLGEALREPYWRQVVAARRDFLIRIRARLADMPPGGPAVSGALSADAAIACLSEALRQHRSGLPVRLVSFVRAWLADRETWAEWFARLPEADGIGEAVARLGWPPEHLLEIPPNA